MGQTRQMGGTTSYHSSGLSMEQAQEFRESFELFDADGSGVIDRTELRGLMKAFGQDLTEDEIVEMMLAVDADGSGEIDFDEFVVLVVSRMENAMMNDERQVRKAFDVFDGDGTGEISTASLQSALAKRVGKAVTEAEAQDMINHADCNGDGTVSFAEFVKFSSGSGMGPRIPA